MNRLGVSLTELLVALLLMGLVSTAVYRVMAFSQRLSRQQAQRVELNDNLRAAAALIPSELRQLSATDPSGSDLIAISESTLAYKAMRSLYLTCAPRGRANVLHLDAAMLGLRGLDAARDSLLIFTGGDRWVHADVLSLAPGCGCRAGAASLDVTIMPAIPDSIGEGSPVRGFEVVEIRRYRDEAGDVWLGGRQHHKVNGWSSLQPLVGPLTSRGFRVDYFDHDGHPTADKATVARIGITVIARSAGATGPAVDSVTMQVALRNDW